MSRNVKVSDIEPLVEKYKGNIAAIARHLGVSRGTIYNRMSDSPTLATAMEDAKEAMIDNAESMLYKQIDRGNITAIIFFLKTQGKGRGYVERQEIKDVTWQDEIVNALRSGEIEPEHVKAAYPSLAAEFFKRAGIDAS